MQEGRVARSCTGAVFGEVRRVLMVKGKPDLINLKGSCGAPGCGFMVSGSGFTGVLSLIDILKIEPQNAASTLV